MPVECIHMFGKVFHKTAVVSDCLCFLNMCCQAASWLCNWQLFQLPFEIYLNSELFCLSAAYFFLVVFLWMLFTHCYPSISKLCFMGLSSLTEIKWCTALCALVHSHKRMGDELCHIKDYLSICISCEFLFGCSCSSYLYGFWFIYIFNAVNYN